MVTRIAFLSDGLKLTGPTVCLYDFADCNETMLKNQSIIFTRPYEHVKDQVDTSARVYEKFQARFPVIYYHSPEDIDRLVEDNMIDVLYILKSGNVSDGLMTTKCKCCIHCLEDSSTPHGDVYAVVGPAVNQRSGTQYPIVPPMIRLDEMEEDLRAQLGISSNALVFGRYGPYESFDIPFVQEYIDACNDPDIMFLFMNTKPFTANPRVIYLNGSMDPRVRKVFMNTCDALLHAHASGEMFGLACGEFAFGGKHVITYGLSKATTHLQLLGDRAMTYRNKVELEYILRNFGSLKQKYSTDISTNLYRKALIPENVMRMFHQTFLKSDDDTSKQQERF